MLLSDAHQSCSYVTWGTAPKTHLIGCYGYACHMVIYCICIRCRKRLVERVLDWRSTGPWFNPRWLCLSFGGVGELALLWLVDSLPSRKQWNSKMVRTLVQGSPPPKKIYTRLGHKSVEINFSQCKNIHYMDTKAAVSSRSQGFQSDPLPQVYQYQAPSQEGSICRSEWGCSEGWGCHGSCIPVWCCQG